MSNADREKSQERAAALLNAVAFPAFLADAALKIREANAEAAEVLGLPSRSNLRGADLRSLCCPTAGCPSETDLAGVWDGTCGDCIALLVGPPAQPPVPFRVRAYRDADEEGHLFLFQARTEASSETAAARVIEPKDVVEPDADSLAEGEWRWRTAVHSANQGIWDHDFENDRHYVSSGWRQLRGMGQDAPIPTNNDTWLETIHPQDRDHIIEEWRKLEAGETEVINYKFRQRHSAGHWVWIFSNGMVVRRDAQGLPARIIGTDTDISDIKAGEAESQHMAQRLEIAMDAAGMGRWEYDVGAKYAFWDDRLLELFGLPKGQNIVDADAWASTIHPEDREAVDSLSQQCLREERDIATDYRLLLKDGAVRHIRTRGKYVKSPERGARYYGVNFDVTADYVRAQQLEAARAELEYESRHDALTGMANRRYLDDFFKALIEQTSAGGARIAVLHFDIDHFKQINDTLGHDAGDATLRHAAQLLQRLLPENALVARVGGDEFVALVPDAPDDDQLSQTADRIIAEMAKPYIYQSQQCNIGTSIGIAVSETGQSLGHSLFIDADIALYQAKKAGRGRRRFFDTAMREEAKRRKNSFDALLAGFDQGEITCHYQPQFDARTLEVTGLEALVRWESSEFGLLMPDEFLGMAEDMGLVSQFDELVLNKALEDIAQWEAAGTLVPKVSVNVSAHRLNDPSLGDRISKLDVPRGRLSFELLESAFLDSKNDVIEQNLRLIEQMGIDIEIDDFGSGHASIVSLLQIAPRKLKIDRLLVQPIVDSDRQRALVETIIQIGRMLEIEVVAEGVETDRHVSILQRLGCGYLQGYALAYPMSAQKTGAFLLERQDPDAQAVRA
ncbi:EAL domain-containing protein [uncultured Roseobacter sp.]|uniref:putative bifunctional diguanylate cyclase/phosphodiesterase n=1 Tax=uncultured Roseobacter sp. TaxID=114847 RepID=UPI002626645D|nr:EAL domain-containing protein [uncultured Roseobacter sp.]